MMGVGKGACARRAHAPAQGSFRTLDFLQASAILRAAEHAKSEIKERLEALLDL
jgi:hypothetical protein